MSPPILKMWDIFSGRAKEVFLIKNAIVVKEESTRTEDDPPCPTHLGLVYL
jgi:hypothetical protein